MEVISSPQPGAHMMQDPVTSLALMALALAVWVLEWRRCRGEFPSATCWALMRQLLPELVASAAMAGLVAALLRRGEHNGAPILPQDEPLWGEIKSEWPVLSTADTLLGLQATLRVLLLASATGRRGSFRCSAFAGEASAFFCFAAVCKVTLLAMSPQEVYHLDGPLGGRLNVALEVSALLMLLNLNRDMPRLGLARAVCYTAALGIATCVATCNRLAIADEGDSHLDTLFSLVGILETMAAAAFVGRAALSQEVSGSSAFACFAHSVLPLQQLLWAYFMLTAWVASPFESDPALVGAGRPLEVLQLCGLAQVSMYLTAGAVYSASCGLEKIQDRAHFLQV
mmetsp:Transcript_90269/g.162777  ORF Transcript_90269/g.162777 Transcript_90269/m.162777 type:complete len:341 (+) Transcript_90269:93-1115(+)